MDSVLALNDKELMAQLRSRGDNPGPVTSSTRKVYEKRLQKLSQNDKQDSGPGREARSNRSERRDNTEDEPDSEVLMEPSPSPESSPLHISLLSRDPCFDLLNNKPEDTRLVRHNKTIYKLKMLFHFTHQVSDICSIETATYELEQVFRAVLYIDQRDGEFQPIGTKHFCVFPRKKYWKIAKKLKFSQNGECLTGNPFYFEFIVKPWKQNKEVEAVRNSETNMKKNENLVEIRENGDSTHEVTDPSYCDEVNGEVTHEKSTKKTDCAMKLKQAKVVLEPCDVDISKYTPKRKSIQFVPVEDSVDENEDMNDKSAEREEISYYREMKENEENRKKEEENEDSESMKSDDDWTKEKFSERSPPLRYTYSFRKPHKASPRLLKRMSLRDRKKNVKYTDSRSDLDFDDISVDGNCNGLSSPETDKSLRVSDKSNESEAASIDVEERQPEGRQLRKSMVIRSSSGTSEGSEEVSPDVKAPRPERKKRKVSSSESSDVESYEPEEDKSRTGKKSGKAKESEAPKKRPVRRPKKQQKAEDSPTNVDNILGNSYRETRKRRFTDTVPDSSKFRKRNLRRLYNPLDEPLSELPSAHDLVGTVNLNKTMPAELDREERSKKEKRKKGRPSNSQKDKEILEEEKECSDEESELLQISRGDNESRRKSVGRPRKYDSSRSSESSRESESTKKSIGRPKKNELPRRSESPRESESSRESEPPRKSIGRPKKNELQRRSESPRECESSRESEPPRKSVGRPKKNELRRSSESSRESESPRKSVGRPKKNELPLSSASPRENESPRKSVGKTRKYESPRSSDSLRESEPSRKSFGRPKKNELRRSSDSSRESESPRKSIGRPKKNELPRSSESLRESESPRKSVEKTRKYESLRSSVGRPRKSVGGPEKSAESSPSTNNHCGLKDVRISLRDINSTPEKAWQKSESARLDQLKKLSHSKEKNSLTEYKSKDRYVIEREEMVEEMKLQEMAKSSSSPCAIRPRSFTSPRKTKIQQREELRSMWSSLNHLITPAKRLFFRKSTPK